MFSSLVVLLFGLVTVSGAATAVTDAAEASPCNDVLRNISVFPGSAEYTAASEIFNQAYASDLPAFIALPRTVLEVQKCLQCSYEHSVPCAVKSGGHSNAGYSTTSAMGFVIYLSRMKQMDWTVDAVKVQAGARWGDVFKEQRDSSLIVSGSCPTVGVAGFTLGGGVSFLSRNFGGFASDNTLSLTMVTANGSSVVVANSTSHPDLYFALRGGGGGNFGVVVDMTFRLHPAQPNYVYGNVTFAGGDASKQVLQMVGESIPFDKKLSLDMSISGNPGSLTIYPFYVGSYEDAMNILKPFIEKASTVHVKSYATYTELYNDHVAATHPTAIAPNPQVTKSCFFNAMPPELATLLFKNPIPRACSIQFECLGGDIGKHEVHETAFFFRDAQYTVFTPCNYENDTEKSKVTEFSTDLYRGLDDAGFCFGSYVNDIDPSLFDWQEKLYGGNYDSLRVIQDQWNPHDKGAYHFRQEIGSRYDPPPLPPLP